MANITKEQRQQNLERGSRAQEARVADPVHEYWDDNVSDSALDTSRIPPREGYVQRWVRVRLKGQEDQSNAYRRYNKGWKPRLKSSVPEGQFVMSTNFNGLDVIGTPSMVLMERPKEFEDRQRRANEQATQMQMAAVKQTMYKQYSPGSGMSRPEFEKENSRVTRGRAAEIDD